jgi:hypothetical protein
LRHGEDALSAGPDPGKMGGLRHIARRSPVVIAGTTLADAALFSPARRRIQEAVDRRFNRRKFDAARTIDHFSARLRSEIDLDALTRHLLEVVDETMEPAHASLWLRTEWTRNAC